MSAAWSPLAEFRSVKKSKSYCWDLTDPVWSLSVEVCRVAGRAARGGIEHDLVALIALIEMHVEIDGNQTTFGVTTPRWKLGLMCNGRVPLPLEEEICRRLQRLDRLIDLGSTWTVRPAVDYLP